MEGGTPGRSRFPFSPDTRDAWAVARTDHHHSDPTQIALRALARTRPQLTVGAPAPDRGSVVRGLRRVADKPVQLGPSAALCSDPVKLDQDYHEQTRSQ